MAIDFTSTPLRLSEPLKEGWTHAEAVALCEILEQIAPKYGAHVALTGGCLYKDGIRKDIDIMLYRIRQADEINATGFFKRVEEVLGIYLLGPFHFNWVQKALTPDDEPKSIDFFFPEGDKVDEKFLATAEYNSNEAEYHGRNFS